MFLLPPTFLVSAVLLLQGAPPAAQSAATQPPRADFSRGALVPSGAIVRDVQGNSFYLSVTDLETTTPAINPIVRVEDLSGRLVHTFENPYPNWGFAELVKPLPNGHLLALVYDRATAASGIPKHKRLAELDWDGNVVWDFDSELVLGLELHHDFQRLPNGDTLLITQEFAVYPNINPNLMRNDILIVVTPLGGVTSIWSMAAHVLQLNLSSTEIAYVRNFPGPIPKAIFHMNSVQSLPPNRWEVTDSRFRTGNLLVSLRELNRVFIIDSVTGNIVWIYTGAIGQHHPRMIPVGLPGAGNILLFDNGGSAGAPPLLRQYSRILEIDPPSQTTVWSYEDLATPFYSDFMGAAQRLANGNTVITESTRGRVFEILPTGEIVWETFHPAGKAYRTYRVAVRWPTKPIGFIW